MNQELTTHLEYYGISPWEIEVVYGYFYPRFTVTQKEIEPNDPDFVSMLTLDIPLEFNDNFFQWFDYRRWEKVKDLFKEMKRRRGSGHAIKIKINFSGEPKITFLLDVEDKQWYNNAVEKIDFVLELLPYHLDPEKLPKEISHITYKFDPKSIRWRLDNASSENKTYVFRGNAWIVT